MSTALPVVPAAPLPLSANAFPLGAPTCLGTGYMTVPAQWQAPPHSHAFTEIIVVVRGRLTVRILGRDYVAGPGDVLTYPPGAQHYEWTDPAGGSVKGSAFYLLAAVAPGWGPIAVLTQDTGSRVTHLARWMYESRGHVHEDRKRISSAYLHGLLGELVMQAKTGAHSPLERVRLYLQHHLDQPHDTAALAARAGLSRFHFIRAYKQYAGHTPMEDLRILRVEAACGLLLTTTLPLKVIAQKVGFCDAYHFSKAFKQEMQIPPGTFRRGGQSGPAAG